MLTIQVTGLQLRTARQLLGLTHSLDDKPASMTVRVLQRLRRGSCGMSYFERMIAVVGNLHFTGARMSGQREALLAAGRK